MAEAVNTDLSDEQIDALLNRAEARLQASEDKIYTRPVVAQSLATSQVIPKNEDSRNQERTQNTTGMDVQHLANGIRRVEDPISKKKRQSEVSIHYLKFWNPSFFDENIPTSLEQDTGTVLAASLQYESHNYLLHSYSELTSPTSTWYSVLLS